MSFYDTVYIYTTSLLVSIQYMKRSSFLFALYTYYILIRVNNYARIYTIEASIHNNPYIEQFEIKMFHILSINPKLFMT